MRFLARYADRVLVAAILLLSFSYFYQAGGWNQNSRFALVRAMVENQSLRIDPFQKSTGDKALVDGHYYCDKAPGLSLAAVPAVAVVRLFLADPTSESSISLLSYVATLTACAIPVVIAALLLFWLAMRWGSTRAGAAFCALAFGLATPSWAYATLFFGHALALSCLIAALAAAVALIDFRSSRSDVLLALGVGVAGGWATLTEYTAVLPAAALCGLALWAGWADSSRRVRIFAGLLAGAVLTALILALYNTFAFGSPIKVSYSGVQGFEGMKQGFMGVGVPNLDVLRQVLFGEFRGLLPLAPFLVLVPFGAFLKLRSATNVRRDGATMRSASWVVLGIVIYYLLVNSAYFYWNGGWTYGPRHLSPALPFACLLLVPVWKHSLPLRILLLCGALIGASMSLMAVSTTAQPPESITRPMRTLHIPAFLDGDLSLNHQSFTEPGTNIRKLRGGRLKHDAWNLGEKLGLRGLTSLLPLLALWLIMLAALVLMYGGKVPWFSTFRRTALERPPSQ